MDGPQYGTSPAPWDIPVSAPQRYADVVERARVPHSSFVKVQAGFSLQLFLCFLLTSRACLCVSLRVLSCVTSATAVGGLGVSPAAAEDR